MFNVGDIIVGNELASYYYTITTSWATLEVIGLKPDDRATNKHAIRVKLIGHKNKNDYLEYRDVSFLVDARHFTLKNIDNRRVQHV